MPYNRESVQSSRLDNGLRVMSCAMPCHETVSLIMHVGVGARYEHESENGLAHFFEHMTFKGNQTCGPRLIAEKIESRGGDMNAVTGYETTRYMVTLDGSHLSSGCEVLGDLLNRSSFPEDELEKERHVILQEISESHDIPEEVVFDLAQALAFPRQALGRPILGTRDVVKQLSSADMRSWQERFYSPQDIVAVACGNVEHEAWLDSVAHEFESLPEFVRKDSAPASFGGGFDFIERACEQVHLVVMMPGVARADARFFAYGLGAQILGGGMSSLLFQEAREKRGLCYAIDARHQSYKDMGCLLIYAGCAPQDLAELGTVVVEGFATMRALDDEAALNRVKAQSLTSLASSRESNHSLSMVLGNELLNFGTVRDYETLRRKINAVDLASTRAVFEFGDQLPVLACVGPSSCRAPLEKFWQELSAQAQALVPGS